MRRAPGISFGERVVSAFFGALFGAAIGAILVWLFGVYSQTMGPGHHIANPLGWVLTASGAFTVLGLVFGSHVGSVIGTVLSSILEFERQEADPELPDWLVIMFLVGVVFAVAWWLSR